MKKEHTHSGLLRAACMATIGIVAAANAAAQQDCRSIEDDALRLACYDGQSMPPMPAEVPQPVETPPKAEAKEAQAAPAAVEPAAEEAPATAAPVAAEAPVTKPTVQEVPAATPAPLDDEIGKESLGREEKDELIVHGTVVRCAKDATKKYLFYFDNGQVWKQKDNTNIRWKECAFDVTITKDFFGYRMIPVGETRRVRIARLK